MERQRQSSLRSTCDIDKSPQRYNSLPMSATTKPLRPSGDRIARPRQNDPRVRRTRGAALAAARTLFLRDGYGGTTMEDVAAEAGLTKRTLYNNYRDKD